MFYFIFSLTCDYFQMYEYANNFFFTVYVDYIFIFIFICIVLFFLKGRLLVGLRWWNHVDDNGEGHWVYESRKVSLFY